MSNPSDQGTDPDRTNIYHIRIKGHLSSRWEVWFEGLTIRLEDNGDSLLTGPVVDQAALHGLLRKVRDLGLPLISIMQVEPDEDVAPDAPQVLWKGTQHIEATPAPVESRIKTNANHRKDTE